MADLIEAKSLFPFIFLTKFNSNVKRTFAIRFTVIAVLSVLALFTFVLIHSMNPTTVYYLMPTRFWEFGAGSMACLLAPKLNNQLAKLGANIVPGSLVILILVMFAPENLNVFATIVAVLAASFCELLPSPASGITTVLTSRVALWIGERSYSIYLWHWVVLTTAKWTIGVTALSAPFILASIFCCSFFRLGMWKNLSVDGQKVRIIGVCTSEASGWWLEARNSSWRSHSPFGVLCSLERMTPSFKLQNLFFLPDATSGRLWITTIFH